MIQKKLAILDKAEISVTSGGFHAGSVYSYIPKEDENTEKKGLKLEVSEAEGQTVNIDNLHGVFSIKV